MKTNWKLFLYSVAIPLVVGTASSLISGDSMNIYEQLETPPLSPPGFLFPIVWTILYTLMGIASYLILSSGENGQAISTAYNIYFIQLIVNFFWSIFFFNLNWLLFSFIWLLLLWVLIVITIIHFYRISPLAAWLLVPYLIWVTFAGYLNLGLYLLN